MSKQVSHKSELRKRYDEEWDMDSPEGDSERLPYVPWLEAELEKALGVISMLEHHWISPMEYYEATEDLHKRIKDLEAENAGMELMLAEGEEA